MPAIKITALTALTTPSANAQNTVFVVVDKSSGTPTTKQLSLQNLDLFVDNVGSVAFAQANGAFAQANTANTTADASFSKANSANVLAQNAYNFANTISSAGAYAHANGAFDKANSANVLAQSAYNAANSANTFDYTTISTTAGVYGNATSVSVITLAANGRVSSITNTAITGFANATYATSAFDFANTTANLLLTFGATTVLDVSANSTIAYNFSQYANGAGAINNPNVSTFSATTLGFNLAPLSGSHPFYIRLGDNSADFDTGLVHISSTGTLSYGSAAQGKTNGTLLWRIPHTSVGNYKYRCSSHPSDMIGNINIANTANIYFAYSS